MSTLRRFDIAGLRRNFGLQAFVETGTGEGRAVEHAGNSGFKVVHSIEIEPSLVDLARTKYPWAQIHCGDSLAKLAEILPTLPSPALFWLDAHFPGAETGHKKYAAEQDTAKRLPLEHEIRLIAEARKGIADVLLIDDARIYEPGPYALGNIPDDWPALQGVERSLDFLRKAYGETHGIVIDYADTGYVMVTPKTTWAQLLAA